MLARVVLRCLAEAAIVSALGPALILLIVASVILGGFGVPVPMLGIWLLESASFRMVFLSGWALLFLPAVRATLGAPGARYLLHFPRAMLIRSLLSGLVILTMVLPLSALVFVGGGAEASVLAMTWILGMQIVLASSVYLWTHRFLQLLSTGGLLALLLSDSIVLIIVLPTLPALVAMIGAIGRGDLGSKRSLRQLLFGGAFVSILGTLLSRIWRSESSLAFRMAIVLVVGVSLSRSGWANNGSKSVEELVRVTLAMQTPVLASIVIMMALANRQSLRELDWLLRSQGVSPAFIRASTWATTMLIGGLSAIAIALASLSTAGGSALWLASVLLLHSLALSSFAHWLCYGWLSGNGVDPSRPAVMMFILAVFLCVVLSMVGYWALFVEVLCIPLAWVAGQRGRRLHA